MKNLIKVGRRSFLKLLAFISLAPVAPFACGNIQSAADRSAINSLLLHLLGIEDRRINLLDRIRETSDEFFDQACAGVVDYISGRYETPSGIDFKMFLDDLNTGGPADADGILYLVEILKDNAAMVFYTSPDGFALAGYERQPFQRTVIHAFIRNRIYPNCYTPCHSSWSCYAACHPAKRIGSDEGLSRDSR